MRRLALALAALALLAPLADAQVGTGGTLAQPIRGAYGDVYVVAGRAIDQDGNPVARGAVVVRLESPGVVAPALDAGTDCFGVFITYFELRHVDHKGKITVAVRGADGTVQGERVEHRLDPFFRRSDFNLTLPQTWTEKCPEQTDLWDQRVTLSGRILNRTEPYVANNQTLEAKPLPGHVRIRYWLSDDYFECPPSSRAEGLCDPVPIDERGDFRYSWVFAEPHNVTGRIEVMYQDQSWNFTPDAEYRYALAMIETSGRGPPPVNATPAAPVAAAIVLAAGLALVLRRGERR